MLSSNPGLCILVARNSPSSSPSCETENTSRQPPVSLGLKVAPTWSPLVKESLSVSESIRREVRRTMKNTFGLSENMMEGTQSGIQSGLDFASVACCVGMFSGLE